MAKKRKRAHAAAEVRPVPEPATSTTAASRPPREETKAVAEKKGAATAGVAGAASYKAGEMVEVFHRMERDGEGYFPVSNQAARCLKPRFGMTDGWVPAKVLEDWPPPRQTAADVDERDGQAPGVADKAPPIRVMHTHALWADRYGRALDPHRERDMALSYPACDVRPEPKGSGYPPVTLSLLVVRWGGEETSFNIEQWGTASASTSSRYISSFLDKTVYPVLGPDYEVHAVFVTSGAELSKVGPAAICQVCEDGWMRQPTPQGGWLRQPTPQWVEGSRAVQPKPSPEPVFPSQSPSSIGAFAPPMATPGITPGRHCVAGTRRRAISCGR